MENKNVEKEIEKKPPLLSSYIFSINNILSIIKKYLIFEEQKSFFSCNKNLNQYFRNSIEELSSKKIINCPNIVKRYPNINTIKFYFGWKADLEFLNNSKNVEYIEIDGANYKNIETIAEIKNLNSLILIGNQLNNINFISKLENLTLLDIGNNIINDLSPLSLLKNLKSLSLQGCRLQNLDILNNKNFIKLEKLYIGQNYVADYSFLKNLQKLQVLNIYNTRNLTKIDFLKYLNPVEIMELNLGENKISDFTPLNDFKNISKLIWRKLF